MRHDIDINKIASMLTDDPDIFKEASKPKSSKKNPEMDVVDVDGKFVVHDGYDEDRDKPAKPGEQRRASDLQKGPKGEEGSKSKKPYIEPKKLSQRELPSKKL